MAVEVWTALVDQRPGVLDLLSCSLSDAEHARTASYLFERDRVRHVFRCGMLRHLLGRRLGVAPERLVFDVNGFGKPRLAVAPLAAAIPFNLSHSGEMVVVAIGGEGEIGVDVEEVRVIGEMDAIARGYFAADERAYIEAAEENRDLAFLRVWTRKEAYVKAVGSGLSIPLQSFGVLSPNGTVAADGVQWSLVDLPLPSGYVGALAMRGNTMPLRYGEWRPSS